MDQPDAAHPSAPGEAGRRAQCRHALSTCSRMRDSASVAVAGLDRREQLLVLGDVGLLPVRLRAAAREQPAPDVGDPERVEDP